MTRSIRINKAFEYLKDTGKVHTQKDLAERMCATPPNVSSALKGNPIVLTDNFIRRFHHSFEEINLTWLLTGEGEMLDKTDTSSNGGNGQLDAEQKAVPERPLVPIDVATRPNFDVYEYVKNTFIPNTTYIGINVLQNYDLCFQANTDALAPTIMKNDILALSAQPKGTFIVNGLPYVIDTYKVGFLLRYAYEIGDKVELRVSNEDSHLTTTTIDKSEIIRMYRIVGLLRLNV